MDLWEDINQWTERGAFAAWRLWPEQGAWCWRTEVFAFDFPVLSSDRNQRLATMACALREHGGLWEAEITLTFRGQEAPPNIAEQGGRFECDPTARFGSSWVPDPAPDDPDLTVNAPGPDTQRSERPEGAIVLAVLQLPLWTQGNVRRVYVVRPNDYFGDRSKMPSWWMAEIPPPSFRAVETLDGVKPCIRAYWLPDERRWTCRVPRRQAEALKPKPEPVPETDLPLFRR